MKIVCAYSGGLDTSCMIPWLREHYDAEIITYTGDLGQGMDLEAVRAKALATGATAAVVDDLRDRFVQEFVWPALRAGALYEGSYHCTPRSDAPSWLNVLLKWLKNTARTPLHMAVPAKATIKFASKWLRKDWDLTSRWWLRFVSGS